MQPSIAVLFVSPFGLISSSEKDLLISCLEVDGLADNILEAKREKGTGQCSRYKRSFNHLLSVLPAPPSLLVFP